MREKILWILRTSRVGEAPFSMAGSHFKASTPSARESFTSSSSSTDLYSSPCITTRHFTAHQVWVSGQMEWTLAHFGRRIVAQTAFGQRLRHWTAWRCLDVRLNVRWSHILTLFFDIFKLSAVISSSFFFWLCYLIVSQAFELLSAEPCCSNVLKRLWKSRKNL